MATRYQSSYIETIYSSLHRYPDLCKFARFLQHASPDFGRATVLEFGISGGSVQRRCDFTDAGSLETYLAQSAAAAGARNSNLKNRLYIVEDLSQPFVETLGQHFWMDPILFAAQEDSTHWIGTAESYAIPRRLPSLSKRQDMKSFRLRYYEVIKSEDDSIGHRGSVVHTISNVRRKIEAGDSIDQAEEGGLPSRKPRTYLVRKNVSFWWRDNKGGGWDGQ